MMLDQDVVATSPASVYRVLSGAGLLDRWNRKPSKKGASFVQPLVAHEHWHIDIAYLNVAGTFYYLCSILDGASRAIVHWDIRAAMTETDVECVLQRAREHCSEAKPCVIFSLLPSTQCQHHERPIMTTTWFRKRVLRSALQVALAFWALFSSFEARACVGDDQPCSSGDRCCANDMRPEMSCPGTKCPPWGPYHPTPALPVPFIAVAGLVLVCAGMFVLRRRRPTE